ncbi:NAD(P)H-dependent oxidoreductase [Wenyingzhuangia sp. 2_MG-2023]|uniref:NAD(P)H-dependent oxidoreductase n=1 Tax=Wenyingzhuangia sp. 2_MG-2023 TaxID=3062639 RepID=UPI0026E27C9E|nr:NAD(P)H-dependent oxidoreductase [Wenyingzhuangia sp. 2_MG-2023]MDO6737456.1 NAD(P)H-dependent oxidoreductase [Wenyingzhuangia sp. 2_MG-2023]
MELLDKLNWRHAVKAMNGQQVPEEKIERILEAIRLTATSSGLQPFEVLIVKNDEIKAQIRPVAWNQSVVTECSHLLVFAAWDTYTADRINEVFDLTNKIRGYENEGFENYRQMLLNTYPQKSAEENFTHAAKQAYIAFGSALIAAAYEGVDATPMEGFDPAAVDEILGLKEKGLRSAILLPLGYRNEENDWLHGQTKVRKSAETMFTTIK